MSLHSNQNPLMRSAGKARLQPEKRLTSLPIKDPDHNEDVTRPRNITPVLMQR